MSAPPESLSPTGFSDLTHTLTVFVSLPVILSVGSSASTVLPTKLRLRTLSQLSPLMFIGVFVRKS